MIGQNWMDEQYQSRSKGFENPIDYELCNVGRREERQMNLSYCQCQYDRTGQNLMFYINDEQPMLMLSWSNWFRPPPLTSYLIHDLGQDWLAGAKHFEHNLTS